MKKIIAVLLTLCVVLSLGVPTFAAEPVTNYKLNTYKDFITYNAPLTNTYKRLTEDRELNIVYYGGSVTEGYGVIKDVESWRALSLNWFKTTFPSATINGYNSAIGGTGTQLGAIRLETDVIERKPDLVFIEFAMNDMYCGLTKQEAARYLETIIRDIRTANPNCDIVTVLIIDRSTAASYKFPELCPISQGHAEISNAYNIPIIDVGNSIIGVTLAGDDSLSNWGNYFLGDNSVHPSKEGYIEYFNCIKEYLTNALLNTDFTGCEKTPHKMPDAVSDYVFDGDRKTIEGIDLKNMVVKSEGFRFDSDETATGIHTHDGSWKANNIENSSLTLKFTGTELLLWTNLSLGSSVTYSIDGSAEKIYNFPNLGLKPIVSGLNPGEHTLVIKPLSLQSDVSVFKIMAVCTRDASKQTECPHIHAPASDTWSKGDTEHYQACECGEKLNLGEHVFGEWAIVKEATETTNGTQKRECEVCGKPETQKYSLNGDVISNSSTPETNVDTDIVTPPSVSSFPVIPVAIGGGVLVALIIAVIIIVSKKKK